MLINIRTNAQKSQFRQVKPGVWQILGIPITVDNAVMNGVYYSKEDNAIGLSSYMGSPVVLRHPEDDNGNGISALSGKGLMDHFSGGVVINTYNHNGVNYIDAEFKEKLMIAQDNGQYYADRLKENKDIGISAGLYFDDNKDCGMAENGEKYYAKATGQIGDHIAMLPEGEDPAGGAATFIRFNGENSDKVLLVNIDEVIAGINDLTEVIEDVATNEQEKGLLKRFVNACKRTFASGGADCDNVNDDEINNNKEVDAMRKSLEEALTAKGIAFNTADTDAALLVKLTTNNQEEMATAITAAVSSAVKPIGEQVTALNAAVTASADKELEALAAQAAPFMDCEVEDAKKLGANSLHKVIAKNGGVVGAPNGVNHKSPKKEAGATINATPWEKK